MFASILSWLTSGGIAAIGKELRLAHEARLKAANESERIEADLKISELEARKATILAAQGDRFERWIRIGFALPFVLYNAKLVLWDKVMGWGATDPLSEDLAYIQITVIGSYFLLASVKAARR